MNIASGEFRGCHMTPNFYQKNYACVRRKFTKTSSDSAKCCGQLGNEDVVGLITDSNM